MDEKSGLLLPQKVAKASMWRRSTGFLVLGGIIAYFLLTVPRNPSPPSYGLCNKSLQPNGQTTYPNEKGLVWDACGELEGRKLECTRLDVPMDHFNATNSSNKTFSLPIIRLRGDDDAKNILVNPGGPGGSGHAWVQTRGKQLSEIIGSGHHIVGFDPRGINGSTPVASCFPDAEARKRLRPTQMTFHPVQDSYNAYAWSKGFAQSCAENLGEHGKYINTPQTAADLNNIIDALGQEEMIYWGFSYGTILGATYATMFPERSHRVMIDGVASSATWYGDRFFLNDTFDNTNDVLFGFFDECVKAGDDCPLSSLADSTEALQQKVLDFAFALEEPLSVFVNTSSWGYLRPEHIIQNGIFSALYAPARWWITADRIAKMLQGNATEAFLAWAGPEIPNDDSNDIVLMNDVLSGQQHWPEGRQAVLDLSLSFLNSSLFAKTWAPYIYRQQQWVIPKTHAFRQKESVETAHPLLILSATYDPVTPMGSALLARDIFQGSQVIERRGYGHGTIAMPSPCVARHVRAFLYNGTVPKDYVKCDEEGPYYKKPDSVAVSSGSRRFEDPEDEAIYQAQLELAKDPIHVMW